MSWSIKPIQGIPAREAAERISADDGIPPTIQKYIGSCLHGIIDSFNDTEVKVDVSGEGHVCGGSGSQAASYANVSVKPSA